MGTKCSLIILFSGVYVVIVLSTHLIIRFIFLVLLEESKISMMQRNKLYYYLRNGEPLPSLSRMTTRSNTRIPEVTIRPGSSKRRSQLTIINSGVYEREKFHRTVPVIDRQKEIEKLQNKMAYREDIKVNPSNILKKIQMKEGNEELNRFDQSEFILSILELFL